MNGLSATLIAEAREQMTIAPDDKPRRRCAPHIVVAFAGKSESGKTTLARAVKVMLERDGHLYVKLEAFANPIKEFLGNQGCRRGDPDFRGRAQRLGQQFRDTAPDHFVALLRERIEAHDGIPCVFLVDDARRKNEGELADIVFRLVTSRPNGLTPGQRAHPSETGWQDIAAAETFVTDHEEMIGPIARRMRDVILAFHLNTREIGQC